MRFNLITAIVDDDADWIELARRALAQSRLEIEIVPFVDGEAAIEHLRRSSVDLVITDVRMPRMDGLTLVRELRKFDPTTPVILMSSDMLTPEEAHTCGANAFVRKGELNTRLARAVQELFAARRPQAPAAAG